MRVTAGFFCEKAYHTTDGKLVAAGIFPGGLTIQRDQVALLECVVMLAQDHDREFKWQVRHVANGVTTLQQRFVSTIAMGTKLTNTSRIPVRWDAKSAEVHVRERGGEWIVAATLSVVETPPAPEPTEGVERTLS